MKQICQARNSIAPIVHHGLCMSLVVRLVARHTDPPTGTVIQAQKAGILRDIITADRCFTITISGQTNDFAAHIGIGKWIQNLAVAAVETLLLTWLFLAVDVPEVLWTRHIEGEIAKKITELAG